jgi:predicted membrane protein
MMQQQQPPTLTQQQQAIQELRRRYEQGEISFDVFELALDALLQAREPEEYQSIVRHLPESPLKALDIPQYVPVQPAMQMPRTNWLVNVIGELKRTKHPWQLAEDTRAVMLIGEMALDLSIATLPPQGVLEIYMGIGELTITVPHDIYVSVQAAFAIGEVKIANEKREGIFCITHDEIRPTGVGSSVGNVPHLEIRVSGLIGEVKIKQVATPAISGQIQPRNERNALPQPKWD